MVAGFHYTELVGEFGKSLVSGVWENKVWLEGIEERNQRSILQTSSVKERREIGGKEYETKSVMCL